MLFNSLALTLIQLFFLGGEAPSWFLQLLHSFHERRGFVNAFLLCVLICSFNWNEWCEPCERGDGVPCAHCSPKNALEWRILMWLWNANIHVLSVQPICITILKQFAIDFSRNNCGSYELFHKKSFFYRMHAGKSFKQTVGSVLKKSNWIVSRKVNIWKATSLSSYHKTVQVYRNFLVKLLLPTPKWVMTNICRGVSLFLDPIQCADTGVFNPKLPKSQIPARLLYSSTALIKLGCFGCCGPERH